MKKILYLLVFIALPALAQKSFVPDEWKVDNGGPYVQAPANCGGEWWYVNPFTGPEPWLKKCIDFTPPQPEPDEIFTFIYGAPPIARDFNNYRQFQAARVRYEEKQKYFGGVVDVPEGFTQAEVDRGNNIFAAWGMGAAFYVKERNGTVARFPLAEVQVDFSTTPDRALNYTHLAIAGYQIDVIQAGEEPTKRHPFVPPSYAVQDSNALVTGEYVGDLLPSSDTSDTLFIFPYTVETPQPSYIE